MSYHKDKECNSALIRLLDELCEWERNSGRRSYLFLIPEEPDEQIIIAQDGKPMPERFRGDLEGLFWIAVNNRKAKQ